MLSESAHRHLADLDRNGAGFDLGQVENVFDEVEEVRSRRMDRTRELGLLLVEVALRIVGEELREDKQRIQWRATLVTHVREEFGFVFGVERKLLGLALDRASRQLALDILRFDLFLLIFEKDRKSVGS